MSFLSDFEKRISSVFGAAPQGYTEPFSFKKLAKRAAREMENETYEIDGVDTAPALYTVLVSASDDQLMRPLYAQITYEISAFVTAQAQKKGYAFVGNPLVRFMVDPSLRSGKFAIFAENVDSPTLERLRAEEQAFLGENSSVGGAAAQLHKRGGHGRSHGAQTITPIPTLTPVSTPLVSVSATPAAPVASRVAAVEQSSASGSLDAGLDVMPAEYANPALGSNAGPDGFGSPVAAASASTPMPVASAPLVGAGDVPGSVPVPQTQLRTPAANRSSASAVTCMLIDRQTGNTYTVAAPSAVIGRERANAQVVLRDPNVSRSHARISYDGRNWRIQDLNSTNGTLVNDVDVHECALRDGDLITLGLVNLEFRENLR